MNMRNDGPIVHGKCGDLGSIHLNSGLRQNLGSCNFCTDQDHHHVTEIQGNHIAVRVCDSCLRKIQEWRPTVLEVVIGGMTPAVTYLRVGDRFTIVNRVDRSCMIQCRYDAEGDVLITSANTLSIDEDPYVFGERIKLNSSGLYCFYLEEHESWDGEADLT